MLCYKDMTFCSAICGNEGCYRNWRLRDKTDYDVWSLGFYPNDGPVAFTDYTKNDGGCKFFKEVKNGEGEGSEATTKT